MHPLVRDMLAVMPADGAPWARADRERWTAALAAVLDVVYADDGRPRAAESTGSPVDLRASDDAAASAAAGRGRHARRGPG